MEHDYEYAFHAIGKFSTSLQMSPRGPLANQHILNVGEAQADGDWWAEWEQNGVKYRLNMKAVPGTVVYTGVGPGRNPATDKVPMVIVRRHGKRTVFEASHQVQ